MLDTWFSSALWPFETLGWPDKDARISITSTPPTCWLPGYDIIFFWVARMIFSGCEHTGKPPFHTVLIHGLVRDDKGRKMSKSLGNGIDPLEMINRFGSDALRDEHGYSQLTRQRYAVLCGALRGHAELR